MREYIPHEHSGPLPPPSKSPKHLNTPLVSFIGPYWSELCEICCALFGRLEFNPNVEKEEVNLKVIDKVTYLTTTDSYKNLSISDKTSFNLVNNIHDQATKKLKRVFLCFLVSDIVVYVCKSRNYLFQIISQLNKIIQILKTNYSSSLQKKCSKPLLIIHFPFETTHQKAELKDIAEKMFKNSNLGNSELFKFDFESYDSISTPNYNETKTVNSKSLNNNNYFSQNVDNEPIDNLDSLINLLDNSKPLPATSHKSFTKPVVSPTTPFITPLLQIKYAIAALSSKDWLKSVQSICEDLNFKLEIGNNRIIELPSSKPIKTNFSSNSQFSLKFNGYKDIFENFEFNEIFIKQRLERALKLTIKYYKSKLNKVCDIFHHDLILLKALKHFDSLSLLSNGFKRQQKILKEKVINVCYRYFKKHFEKCLNTSINSKDCVLLKKYCKSKVNNCKSGFIIHNYCSCGVSFEKQNDLFLKAKINVKSFKYKLNKNCCNQNMITVHNNDKNKKCKSFSVYKHDMEYDEFYGMKMYQNFIDDVDKLDTFYQYYAGLEYVSFLDGSRIIMNSDILLKCGLMKYSTDIDSDIDESIWPLGDIPIQFKIIKSHLSMFHKTSKTEEFPVTFTLTRVWLSKINETENDKHDEEKGNYEVNLKFRKGEKTFSHLSVTEKFEELKLHKNGLYSVALP